MSVKDITDSKDGTRIILLDTPCGFEIALMRMKDGQMKMTAYFEHQLINLTDGHYRLSQEGAMALAENIRKIYING